MDRRQVWIVGGLLLLGLAIIFPLTQILNEPDSAQRQALARMVSPQDVIHQTDGNGVDWAITPMGRRPAAVDPNADPAKPVVIVKTEVFRASKKEVLIGLVLAGRDGQGYQPGISRGGQRLPAPKLRIVNEAGQVVLDDSFKYG